MYDGGGSVGRVGTAVGTVGHSAANEKGLLGASSSSSSLGKTNAPVPPPSGRKSLKPPQFTISASATATDTAAATNGSSSSSSSSSSSTSWPSQQNAKSSAATASEVGSQAPPPPALVTTSASLGNLQKITTADGVEATQGSANSLAVLPCVLPGVRSTKPKKRIAQLPPALNTNLDYGVQIPSRREQAPQLPAARGAIPQGFGARMTATAANSAALQGHRKSQEKLPPVPNLPLPPTSDAACVTALSISSIVEAKRASKTSSQLQMQADSGQTANASGSGARPPLSPSKERTGSVDSLASNYSNESAGSPVPKDGARAIISSPKSPIQRYAAPISPPPMPNRTMMLPSPFPGSQGAKPLPMPPSPKPESDAANSGPYGGALAAAQAHGELSRDDASWSQTSPSQGLDFSPMTGAATPDSQMSPLSPGSPTSPVNTVSLPVLARWKESQHENGKILNKPQNATKAARGASGHVDGDAESSMASSRPPEEDNHLSFEKTIELYRQNARRTNDPVVQLEFAKLLLCAAPEFPEKSQSLRAEAIKIGRRSAAAGCLEAMLIVAACHELGFGSSKRKANYTAAFSMYMQAVKMNSSEAVYRAGYYYEHGLGTTRSSPRAVHFYEKAATMGHPAAYHRLGMAELKGDLNMAVNPRNAVKWLKYSAESATNDYPIGLHDLALLHETGIENVIFPDELYSLQLLEQASELGHVPSMYRLGSYYEHGFNKIKVDLPKAFIFYKKAARAGHLDSMFGIASWYLTGNESANVPCSENRAYRWMHKAARNGLPRACFALGFFFEEGVSIPVDYKEALKWYQKALEGGEARAEEKIQDIETRISELANTTNGENYGTEDDSNPQNSSRNSSKKKNTKSSSNGKEESCVIC